MFVVLSTGITMFINTILEEPEQSMNIESMKRNVRHHLIVTNSILDYYSSIKDNNVLEKVVAAVLEYLISLQVDLSGWLMVRRSFQDNYIVNPTKFL